YEAALGLRLGVYQFNTCKSADPEHPPHELTSVELIDTPLSAAPAAADDAAAAPAAAAAADALARAEITAAAVKLARDLVNEPPNICTPERLAGVARDLAAFEGVGVKVLGRAEIEALGMGGLVAVSQGATREPRFIHVHYRPALPEGVAPRGSLALIGKGLTFDSGGLSLKPPKSQEDMHIDMGGAAAVLGALWALVRLRPDVELHGVVGACENMPDGNSFRPSDILTMYSKKTVEVLNTDAEGRLVLADALHYAAQLKPDAMVDLATLTGACMVGLGTNYCGLLSDDDALAATLLAAGDAAQEKLWRLPLDEGLADTLKSKRADLTNLGGPYGGAITAALFLKHFKGDRRWAHLDIAAPTTASKDKGATSAGATGFGVLTLIELARSFERPLPPPKDHASL
ncbi:MAG: leucyl aminopeptidase, partial [Deltaproteobacteria bacterium]|nr:leucyl aminopeptidase [Deltaproteobacteria bacterium]